MDADHVDHEDVASPSRHHVDVGEAGQQAHGPVLRRPNAQNPQPKGGADGSDRHGFVVEFPSYGPHQVCRDDGHDQSGAHPRIHTPGDLVGQEPREEGRIGAEPRRDHAADVVDTHGAKVVRGLQRRQEFPARLLQVGEQGSQRQDQGGGLHLEATNHLHGLPDPNRSHLHAGVDRCADWPAEWIPGFVVIPLEELLQAILCEVFCSPVVEPGIKLVDDVAIVLDGIEADLVGCVCAV
mmetsp:Transcript_10978/g.26470  ORF Transcript_10978/g.26470 Transcript_10978/m.26470 type:complete len:238 (-) Transcript_10978:222-935(-)